MASTISAGTTTTTALVYSADTSGVLQLQTNGTTTAVTIDTNQNVGLGVTPSAWGSSYKAVQMSYATMMNSSSGGYYGANFYYNSSGSPTYVNNGYALAYSAYSAGGAHLWLTAPSGTAGNAITFTQAMTLDASGNLIVGGTNAFGASSSIIATNGFITGSGGGLSIGANSTNNTFYTSSLGSGSTTMYIGNKAITAVSDVRIKDNIKPTEINAVQTLNQWQIIDHTWNDPSDTAPVNRNTRGTWVGVTAQQIIDSTPWLVNAPDKNCSKCKSGEHCEEHTSLWQVDFEYSVPLLVKAIQEQQAMITTLQTQVTALKG